MPTIPKRLLAELRRMHAHAAKHYDPDAALDAPLQVTESIWVYADPTDVTSLVALILGTPDTPYENGFFFFRLKVPSDYPNIPPKVTLLTLDTASRLHFNPNMYANGKVCLSILGTWDGPRWTCAMTIESLCVNIQSLFVPDPLTNEPTYEKRTPQRAYKYETYNAIIEHATLRVAVWNMLQHPPAECDVFQPLLQQLFLKRADAVLACIDERITKYPQATPKHCDMWFKFSETLNYPTLRSRLSAFRDELVAATTTSAPAPAPTPQPAPQSAPAPTPDATTPAPPPKKTRVYYRRPTKADAVGKEAGAEVQKTQKDGTTLTFRLVAGKKDPSVLRWFVKSV